MTFVFSLPLSLYMCMIYTYIHTYSHIYSYAMSFAVYHINRHMMSLCLTTGNVNLDHLLRMASAWFPHFYSFVINKYFVSDTLRLFKCTVSQKTFTY